MSIMFQIGLFLLIYLISVGIVLIPLYLEYRGVAKENNETRTIEGLVEYLKQHDMGVVLVVILLPVMNTIFIVACIMTYLIQAGGKAAYKLIKNIKI